MAELGDEAQIWKKSLSDVWKIPWTQIIIISLVCFCCPGKSSCPVTKTALTGVDIGMYNAIGGLGGSGQLDSTVAANATVALLAATAASALTLVPPMFGPRTCLLLGGWCYPLYSGSLLCYNHTGNSAFVITSGAILGIGASFLWVAQGAIMVSYPLPDQKGRAIALFWVVFNLGGGIGSFISFALNFHSKSGTVTDGTYAAFIAIMVFGWLLSVFIAPPHKVVRQDGTFAGSPPERKGFTASVRREFSNFVTSMANWKIILLIPAFFCANFFYSYQQNNVNGDVFTLRTRSLNGAMYWIAQMFGGLLIGFLLDLKWLTRPQRALLGYVFVFATGFAIWGGGLAFQRWANRIGKKQWLDFTDSRTYIGPFWLYFFYGAFDAFWQSFCYWLMASLAPNPQAAAKFVGLYKTFQATGGAVAWRINALHYRPLTQLTINWALFGSALVVALPTVLAITPSPAVDGAVDGLERSKHDDATRLEPNDIDSDLGGWKLGRQVTGRQRSHRPCQMSPVKEEDEPFPAHVTENDLEVKPGPIATTRKFERRRERTIDRGFVFEDGCEEVPDYSKNPLIPKVKTKMKEGEAGTEAKTNLKQDPRPKCSRISKEKFQATCAREILLQTLGTFG
ncbi:UNC93-like protein 2 [Leucoagaricus sp. SymC.cos]|nr:UNC93-like protein 2 [Leucoagaricus sp. SymC.cos]